VDYASKLFPENDVEIYRMNLEDIQFEDQYFDTVCISNSLHHLENPDKVIAELLRVLKPEGFLLIAEMYSDGEQSPAQETHILMHHWIAGVDMLSGVYHRNTFTRAELRSIADKLPLNKLNIIDFYVPVDNPSKNCETLIRNCKDTIKRLESMPDSDSLVDEGNTMLKRISEIGCASASRLIITGYKPKGDR
jgi:ubiquinone/menaquinone biosynthesis C-methylase UbiE